MPQQIRVPHQRNADYSRRKANFKRAKPLHQSETIYMTMHAANVYHTIFLIDVIDGRSSQLLRKQSLKKFRLERGSNL